MRIRAFAQVREQLDAYFDGERVEFDVPLSFDGAPAFFESVWRRLLAIPFGATVTYGELARELGRPTAARAVGMANGRNPISVIVPCHRVIGAAGDLTGYAGGLDRKRYLLRMRPRSRAGSHLRRSQIGIQRHRLRRQRAVHHERGRAEHDNPQRASSPVRPIADSSGPATTPPATTPPIESGNTSRLRTSRRRYPTISTPPGV